jgi:hypothetical protein
MPSEVDGAPLSDAEAEQLANALAQRESLTADDAERLARSVAAMDPAVLEVARAWLRTGKMPNEPMFWGYSPARVDALSSNIRQTFTSLHGLTEELPGVTIALLEKRRDQPST